MLKKSWLFKTRQSHYTQGLKNALHYLSPRHVTKKSGIWKKKIYIIIAKSIFLSFNHTKSRCICCFCEFNPAQITHGPNLSYQYRNWNNKHREIQINKEEEHNAGTHCTVQNTSDHFLDTAHINTSHYPSRQNKYKVLVASTKNS